MTRTRTGVVSAAFFLLAAAVALTLVLLAGKSSGSGPGFASKAGGEAVEAGESNAAQVIREGPTSFEQWRAQTRTYPAKAVPTKVVARARATFNRIAARDARRLAHARRLQIDGHKWKLYGPTENATEPGVLGFSGATNNTASRVTALVADPDCNARHCRLWTGVSGGGVWRTDNATAKNPEWKQISPDELDQNSVGTLTLLPGKAGKGKGNGNGKDTLYLGTGEANRCTSGCESGVGIYRSKDGGQHWQKLADTCVSNAVYPCVTPGIDAFLGRGINSIVIDPRNSNHLLVGSARGVRGLSHVIGAGGSSRFEPGANDPGVYESNDGGATFTMVWDGTKPDCTIPRSDPAAACAGTFISYGITDLGLDPLNPSVVYASGFDAGVWRRDAGAAATTWQQVFRPQFKQNLGTPPTVLDFDAGIDRSMFALTVKTGKTRIYLTDGTAAGGGPNDPFAANFWRTDNGQLPAATLLASQPSVTPLGTGCVPPDPATHAFPASYNAGWQCLTSRDTSNPYFPTQDFCWAQCWYDEEVYTPVGKPDTVYVIGAMQYDEQPCDTKGVGCGFGHDAAGQGAGMSNGRAVLYSTTGGDPDSAAGMRTFTDLTNDAQDTPAPWCAFAPYAAVFGFTPACRRAPNGIHPDQHAIVVNPGNPTQIFEGSDGGVISTSGTFADISSQCDEAGRDGATGGPVMGADNVGCKRLLSRVPVVLDHINRRLSSTLQFINVAINPANSCEVMGGTQDNGTWSNTNNCRRDTFNQVIYGDGGNAVYDGTEPTWRANEFTSGGGDSNFRNGDPERWVVATAPIRRSGEGPAFYWPQVGDPNPAPGTHPIYSGARHVWRTLAFGGGTATQAGPQATTPNIAFMESHCQEFVVGSTTLGCGDYRPMGGPYCDGLASTTTIPSCINQPGDLAGTAYGVDRQGLVVSWVARDSADHGTVWAVTGAGRVFVTHNGDAGDPSTVTWHRIDNPTSPTRYPSGIYVDPANPSHAWISYSGFNASTPSTPGHVFDVTEGNPLVSGSGTFTNLNVESGTSAFPTPTSTGDLPVSGIVRDDATHTLYVGTDFGVLAGPNDGQGGWHVMKGMPRYMIMHLEIQPSNRVPICTGGGKCKRVLYAATHSQGIWRLDLGRGTMTTTSR